MAKHLGIEYGSMDEVYLLREHDEGETLHAYEAKGGEVEFPEDWWACKECGDDPSGLMHNNTWRNVEPLMGEQ